MAEVMLVAVAGMRRTALSLLISSLVLAACAPQPVESPPTSASAVSAAAAKSAAPPAPTRVPTDRPTEEPTASPTPSPALLTPGTAMRVLVDLRVRSGPGTDYPMLLPALWGADGVEAVHETLTAGETVGMAAGPLWIGGMPWYFVDARDPHYEFVYRDDPNYGYPGWIAGADSAGNLYLRVDQVSEDASYDFLAAGSGDAVTQLVPQESSQALSWIAAADTSASRCQFRVVYDSTGEVITDGPVDGVARLTVWWLASTASALRIESDCAWYVAVRHGVVG